MDNNEIAKFFNETPVAIDGNPGLRIPQVEENLRVVALHGWSAA